jgi:hypothetical protein
MAIWMQETRAKVGKFKNDKANIKHSEKITTANISTSEKDRLNDGKYLYSNWSFVRFVGKAHTYMLENVKDGDAIFIKSGKLTKVPYERDGKTVYPETEQIVVFDVVLWDKRDSGEQTGSTEDDEEKDIPF